MSNYPDVWIFDINRRVYLKDGNGRSFGSPIWREHWKKIDVVGETRVSWLTSCRRKIPKKGGHDICFSLREIEDRAWIHENAHRLAGAVSRCTDIGALREIAHLVGYQERP